MGKDRELMQTTAYSPTVPTRKRRGRKRVRGALEFDKRSGRVCWLLGYCEECGGKVTADTQEMQDLKLSVHRQKKKLGYRLLMRLLARYETQ